MNITTTITIPSAPAYFEGHFPGNPILPGVAEIALVQTALADEIPNGNSLQTINFMRFRQIVLPGDCLELSAKTAENGCLRVELKREGTLVANGEWGLGRLDEHKKASPLAGMKTSPLSEIPSLDELLPHRPPMRFLDAILSETTESLTCTATIPAACPLVNNGSVPAVVGLEAAAQAAAAWGALQSLRTTDAVAPRVGYLVALREILFFSEAIPAETRLHIEIKLEAAAPPLSHYRVVISQEDKLLAQGLIATFLKEGDE